MDNHAWSHERCFFSSKLHSGDRVTRSCALSKLELSKGDKFKYLFDFGDEWVFQCKVLQVLDEATAKPVVVRSVGEAPEQYPQWEDEVWDEEWEDDDPVIQLAQSFDEKQLKKMYSDLPVGQETIACLHQYFEAAANLYGVIPVSKLLEIYNSQNEPIPDAAFYAFAEIVRHEEHDYFILSRQEVRYGAEDSKPEQWEIVADHLLEVSTEVYFDFISDQRKGTYKILPKEDFLCYRNEGSLPKNPQNDAMLRYLQKKSRDLMHTPEKICQTIQRMLCEDCCLQEIMELLSETGLQFSSAEDMNEFMQLYQELNNHTRKQVNRGYTPIELIEKQSIRIPAVKPVVLDGQISMFDEMPQRADAETSFPKVGRNDPCPCGSGLKYKKCCGKT